MRQVRLAVRDFAAFARGRARGIAIAKALVVDTKARLEEETASSLSTRTFSRTVATKLGVVFVVLAGLVACSGAESGSLDDEQSEDADDDDGESDSFASSSDALRTAGPCAGTAIDRAVKCAVNKGARVLSFYRSPAEQERVRRENGCTNRCTGQAGCVRPTAGCTTSPHTRCRAVDLVNDGAPLTRTQLRSCGLAKTTAPHRNHYDLVN